MISYFKRLGRHLFEFAAVAAEENSTPKWWPIIRALLTGYAGKRVWRQRMQTCLNCPIYDRQFRRCRGPMMHGVRTGCGCYVVFQAATKAPYRKGCWGRQVVGGLFGWPAV